MKGSGGKREVQSERRGSLSRFLCALLLCGAVGLIFQVAWGRDLKSSASSARKVHLDVRLSNAVPQVLMLSGGAEGYSMHDSVWEDSRDGRYHFTIKDFRPGYYQLHVSDADVRIPLLLLEPDDSVHIALRGDGWLSGMRVEGAGEAEIYARAHGALRSYEGIRVELERVNGGSVKSSVDALLLRLRHDTDSALRSLQSVRVKGPNSRKTIDVLLRMQLEGLWGADSTECWWPEWITKDSLLSGSVELKYRVDDFLRSFHRLHTTREEQDSLYELAFGQWVGLPMVLPVAEVLGRRAEYTFSGTGYYPIWCRTRERAFPGVVFPPLAEAGGGVVQSGVDRRVFRVRIKDIRGQRYDLVSREHAYTAVVVWSVWCDVCRGEVPGVLDSLVNLSVPGGLAVRSVAMEVYDPFARAHIEHQSLAGVQVVLKETDMNSLLDGLGVHGTPGYFLFDREGRRVSRPLDSGQLFEVLQRNVNSERGK